MTKEAKKAIKFYKKNGFVSEIDEKAILSSMTDEEIEKAIRPFQEKFLKKKISNIASRLYKEASFDNILYMVMEFNSIKNMSTQDNKTLDDLYALTSQFLSKYDYAISHNIILPDHERRDSAFTFFDPIICIHYCEKDELNGLFNLKSDGKYYTGILGNALYLKRDDLALKIIKNICLPYFENYNNTSDLVLDNGYVYDYGILTIDKNYKDTLEFMETFDIKFNLEKELYFDCFGKVMASMCLPVRKKDDYELTKDRIKAEFTRYSKASEKVYSELFYEVLYRNFSKKEKQDIIDLYIQNTIKAIMKSKDENRRIEMLYDMTRYFTDSINVISEMWDTFKQVLGKNQLYPYNSGCDYLHICEALNNPTIVEDLKYANMFLGYEEFINREASLNKYEDDLPHPLCASVGFLTILKKSNCELILNDILNNLVRPMKNDKNAAWVIEWFELNGYSL